jgi:hypothetical protein
MIKRKVNETYYSYNCRRVANDLDMTLWEVKLVTKYFFKGINKLINNYELFYAHGLFKLLLRKKYFIKALVNNKLHESIYKKNK